MEFSKKVQKIEYSLIIYEEEIIIKAAHNHLNKKWEKIVTFTNFRNSLEKLKKETHWIQLGLLLEEMFQNKSVASFSSDPAKRILKVKLIDKMLTKLFGQIEFGLELDDGEKKRMGDIIDNVLKITDAHKELSLFFLKYIFFLFLKIFIFLLNYFNFF